MEDGHHAQEATLTTMLAEEEQQQAQQQHGSLFAKVMSHAAAADGGGEGGGYADTSSAAVVESHHQHPSSPQDYNNHNDAPSDDVAAAADYAAAAAAYYPQDQDGSNPKKRAAAADADAFFQDYSFLSPPRNRQRFEEEEDDVEGPAFPHDTEEEDVYAPIAVVRPPATTIVRKANVEQWDQMFQRLLAYKNMYGNCLVPKRYLNDPQLGTWVETQRVQYKKLARSETDGSVLPNKRLTAERLERLESIGFCWSAKHVRMQQQQAQATTPPSSNNKSLASSSTQGAPARKWKLQDQTWNEMYQRLVEYKEQHGHVLVPRKYPPDPKLGTWVEQQRLLYNKEQKLQLQQQQQQQQGGTTAGEAGIKLPDPPSLAAVAKPQEADYVVLPPTVPEQELPPAEGYPAAVPAVVQEAVEGGGVLAPPPDSALQQQQPLLFLRPRLTAEHKAKLDALGFVWSLRTKRIEDHWDDMFQQLCLYKQQHGDCLVPSRYEANLKLGKWVETQRYEYTKLQRSNNNNSMNEASGAPVDATTGSGGNPRLTPDRLRRLESIGFEWKVKNKMKRYYDRQWDQMFERLLAFKEREGHCMVPKRYPPDIKLGTWVHTQRIQYRKLMAGTTPTTTTTTASATDEGEAASFRLTQERRRRLEEIGFHWSAREGDGSGLAASVKDVGSISRNSYDDQWDAMFQQLVEYKKKHGHCLVPKRCKESPKLGTWVDTQRVQYKKLQKKLAEQQQQGISGTESVAASDGSTVASSLDDGGVGVVATAGCADEDSTAASSAAMSGSSSKPLVGRLTDDRIRRLQELGFVWSLRDDWQKHFDALKEFKKEFGNCNVPARYSKNRRLGIWVSAQRQQYKLLQQAAAKGGPPLAAAPRRAAPLTQERINALNDIGFTWTIRSRDALGDTWNRRLQELKAFKEIHGHCNVPSRYPASPELGVWVGTQRTQYRIYMKMKQQQGQQQPPSLLRTTDPSAASILPTKDDETNPSLDETALANSNNPSSSAMNEDRIRELEALGFQWQVRGGGGTGGAYPPPPPPPPPLYTSTAEEEENPHDSLYLGGAAATVATPAAYMNEAAAVAVTQPVDISDNRPTTTTTNAQQEMDTFEV